MVLHNGWWSEEQIIYPNQAVFVDKMIWDYQIFETGQDNLAVLCSTEYDQTDYITDFRYFQQLARDSHATGEVVKPTHSAVSVPGIASPDLIPIKSLPQYIPI